MIVSNKMMDAVIAVSATMSELAANGDAFKEAVKELKAAKKEADTSLTLLADSDSKITAREKALAKGEVELEQAKAELAEQQADSQARADAVAAMLKDADLRENAVSAAEGELQESQVNFAKRVRAADRDLANRTKKLDVREEELIEREARVDRILSAATA